MRSVSSLYFLFCLVALAMAACSLHSNGPGTAPVPEPKLSTEMAKQAQAQFVRGRFKRALELYSDAFDKYHHPLGLRRGYVKMGEQIKSIADTDYQKGDVEEAGIDYSILLESGITTRDFAGTLSFDDDYLNRQIKACSKALMERGLMKYREEKLDEAIEIWKKALFFDPDNENIKNALETAAAQLHQLKLIK
jgi:tetratricopeptide (TPR) repeat protein